MHVCNVEWWKVEKRAVFSARKSWVDQNNGHLEIEFEECWYESEFIKNNGILEFKFELFSDSQQSYFVQFAVWRTNVLKITVI